tara:strand:- start:342 stop:698 length:357 start_codon:yes stop_codon:yes gene_type:complete
MLTPPLYRQFLADKLKAMTRVMQEPAAAAETVIRVMEERRLLDSVLWDEVANADPLAAAMMRNADMDMLLHRLGVYRALKEVPTTALTPTLRVEPELWSAGTWLDCLEVVLNAEERAA